MTSRLSRVRVKTFLEFKESSLAVGPAPPAWTMIRNWPQNNSSNNGNSKNTKLRVQPASKNKTQARGHLKSKGAGKTKNKIRFLVIVATEASNKNATITKEIATLRLPFPVQTTATASSSPSTSTTWLTNSLRFSSRPQAKILLILDSEATKSLVFQKAMRFLFPTAVADLHLLKELCCLASLAFSRMKIILPAWRNP